MTPDPTRAAPPPNDAQSALWNGSAGRAWIAQQASLDSLFEPFERRLVETTRSIGARDVLDVGCGTGATTLAIARALGAAARCTGVDLSVPMIASARERASREGSAVRFVAADAQTAAFDPASFDRIVSRFGVMFFDDPVRAFARLRGAAKPGATLALIAWRSPAENPFMTTAERAASSLLPELPARRADAPGQFAFADPTRVRAILDEAGWRDLAIEPYDVACELPARALDGYLRWMGPVGGQLQQADDATREAVLAVLRRAFEPFRDGDVLRFGAACWWIAGRAA